jgi:hypothetical protein
MEDVITLANAFRTMSINEIVALKIVMWVCRVLTVGPIKPVLSGPMPALTPVWTVVNMSVSSVPSLMVLTPGEQLDPVKVEK